MVAGVDRYFQIARCFRDEDLRADRQPEFTQIDMEMSFADMEDIIALNEGLMKHLFKETLDIDVSVPFQRMAYKEAMERFGSDKPDVRFGMELINITDLAAKTDFGVFKGAIEAGGSVRLINAGTCGNMPRKQIDALVEYARTYGAKGLAWAAITGNPDDAGTGDIKSSFAKFLTEEQMKELFERADTKNGDLLLICADTDKVVFNVLGALRCHLAKKLELYDEKEFKFLWITEFPLFEWDDEEQRYAAVHHPFTSPDEEDIPLLDTDPGKVRAKAYDLILNGVELGGGSMRIYQSDLQEKVFGVLGFTTDRAYQNFGHLLTAFKFGVPPHGGIAYGFDRLIMLMTGAASIRDVIAFPKVKDASCPLTGAPGEVAKPQLNELGISVIPEQSS
jgi:aspartyl-tRNA synthetase